MKQRPRFGPVTARDAAPAIEDPGIGGYRGGVWTDSAPRTATGRGALPVTESYTVSKIRGQHRTKPHSDRSSRVGQAWSRHPIIGTLEASSLLTGEIIKVNVLGPADPCPYCGEVPRWNREGDLICECRTWSGPSEKKPREDPDSVNERASRNQNYQRDLRRFFKKGGRYR